MLRGTPAPPSTRRRTASCCRCRRKGGSHACAISSDRRKQLQRPGLADPSPEPTTPKTQRPTALDTARVLA
eukprot:13221714-Alexandrium_andersonii.AAC.1